MDSIWSKKSFAEVISQPQQLGFPIKQSGSYKGFPAIFLSKEEERTLAQPFQYALVGKFSHGRPNMQDLRKAFQTFQLKGSVSLGLLDSKHVLIQPALEEDYIRLWMKSIWQILGLPMRILKWSPMFRTSKEPSIVPTWISFEQLPIHLFHKPLLFSLAQVVGTPLKIDEATAMLTRPSVARVCVEVDILKELPTKIWIGTEDDGFWQGITYDDLPSYCTNCFKVGHSPSQCKRSLLSTSSPSMDSGGREEDELAQISRQHGLPSPTNPLPPNILNFKNPQPSLSAAPQKPSKNSQVNSELTNKETVQRRQKLIADSLHQNGKPRAEKTKQAVSSQSAHPIGQQLIPRPKVNFWQLSKQSIPAGLPALQPPVIPSKVFQKWGPKRVLLNHANQPQPAESSPRPSSVTEQLLPNSMVPAFTLHPTPSSSSPPNHASLFTTRTDEENLLPGLLDPEHLAKLSIPSKHTIQPDYHSDSPSSSSKDISQHAALSFVHCISQNTTETERDRNGADKHLNKGRNSREKMKKKKKKRPNTPRLKTMMNRFSTKRRATKQPHATPPSQ